MFSVSMHRTATLRVAVITAVWVLSVAACTPMTLGPAVNDSPLPPPPTRVPGEEVPFTPLWQGEVSNNCDTWTEKVSLATTEEEYADIVALVSGDYLLLPSGFPNWESLEMGADEALVNIWRGCGDSCELDITTKSIVKTDEHALTIYAELRRWRPDQACSAVVPSIAQLIRIPWDRTPASETQISLVLYPVYR